MPIRPIETTTGPLEYSVSSRFGYRFSRYLILPRISESEEFRSGEPFALSPKIAEIVNEYLTPQEQQAAYVRPNGRNETVIDSIRWFVRYVGREIRAIELVERGFYRMPTGEAGAERASEEIEEELVDESDSFSDGWLYAFTFPELMGPARFPIKIGMTIRDVEERVSDQCRGSAVFSQPVVLGSWRVSQASLSERTVHCLMKLSGQWRSDAPGSEWFTTNLEEITRVVNMVIAQARSSQT